MCFIMFKMKPNRQPKQASVNKLVLFPCTGPSSGCNTCRKTWEKQRRTRRYERGPDAPFVCVFVLGQ